MNILPPSLRMILLACGLIGVLPTAVEAGWISLNEKQLDSIFSQSSFGSSPIDIRYDSAVTVVDPDLTSIDSWSDFQLMSVHAPQPTTHINMFFVDTITWCGGAGSNIIGCGAQSGTVLAVASLAASGSHGAELKAHEMGHNLGLGHTTQGLMGPTLNGDTTLTLAETSIILASPLVQSDALGRFIQVTPVLVRATAVPEPSCTVLICIVAASLKFRRRR